MAKRGKAPVIAGPHSLAKQEWPPAITPDFVGVVDKGYALIANQSGRLAIVDLKREDGPLVVGELTGLGKKVIDLCLAPKRAYALAHQDQGTETQYILVIASTEQASNPSIISTQILSNLQEPTCLAASPEVICVGGTGTSGEPLLLVFATPKRGAAEPLALLSTIKLEQPVTRLELLDRQLVALSSGPPSVIELIGLSNPRSPERSKPVRLEGHFPIMSRSKEGVLVAGSTAPGKFEARMLTVKPALQVVSREHLPVTEILDAAAQKGQFLILANHADKPIVVPVSYDKALNISIKDAVALPQGNRGANSKAKISVRDKDAYVASDWGGVQVLNIKKTGWQYMYSHTIPRLPAAAVAVSGGRAVLAAADLKLYDISHPEHPFMVESTDMGSSVRALASIDGNMLCLTRDQLTLRRVDRPGDVLASLKIGGNSLAYDSSQRRAYVIDGKDKGAVVTPVRVANTLSAEPALDLPRAYRRGCAADSKLVLAGMSDISVFSSASDNDKPAGTRHFDNLALRDLCLSGQNVLVSAVDPQSRGFLLILSTYTEDLTTVSSIDLPHNAVAVAVSGDVAIAVGRNPQGKDMATLVNIANPVQPKVGPSFRVVEGASAIAIANRMAVVVGRGLEILTLS